MSHFTTINAASYLFNFQPSDQTIFPETSPSHHRNRQSDQNPDQTTTFEYTRDHHQTRPPNQTIRSADHHRYTRPPVQITPQTTGRYPWLLSFQSAQQTQPLEMVQVRCILYGLGRGGYIELWMKLAKHTFHTRSAWSFRNFFWLNLIVVRLASGFPWAGKGLLYPFS